MRGCNAERGFPPCQAAPAEITSGPGWFRTFHLARRRLGAVGAVAVGHAPVVSHDSV